MIQHPESAQAIREWQRDAQALRGAMSTLPASGSFLDTAIARVNRRRRLRRSAAFAALLLLAINVGGWAGWQMRGLDSTAKSEPMADAMLAYRLFAVNRQAPFDLTQTHAGELQAWLDQHFPRATRLPDLTASGFHVVGGRLLANTSGPAALVVYRDAEGDVVSFYVRLPGPDSGLLQPGERRDGRLAATYWSAHGYNYALVGRAGVSDLRVQYN
jgi:anti-sigma factor RsiW